MGWTGLLTLVHASNKEVAIAIGLKLLVTAFIIYFRFNIRLWEAPCPGAYTIPLCARVAIEEFTSSLSSKSAHMSRNESSYNSL